MSHPHLILLHGALGGSSQFHPFIPSLKESFEIHHFDFEGHGQSRFKNRPLRIEHFSENLLDYLNAHRIDTAYLFGHSMGGHVGIFMARFFPERVSGVFTLGTKFLWTTEIAEKENAFLLPETLLRKVPHFAEELKQRHAASGWEPLLENVREMHLYLGRHSVMSDEDMRRISIHVRIGVGDRDRMASIEESVRVYRMLQKGELQIFPHTPHPLEKVSIKQLTDSIIDFFKAPQ
jgi:pimeloyl-ACP methyl ester carboxylesterase